jgi:hypothetical protein
MEARVSYSGAKGEEEEKIFRVKMQQREGYLHVLKGFRVATIELEVGCLATAGLPRSRVVFSPCHRFNLKSLVLCQ